MQIRYIYLNKLNVQVKITENNKKNGIWDINISSLPSPLDQTIEGLSLKTR